jgi:hypothetical protein
MMRGLVASWGLAATLVMAGGCGDDLRASVDAGMGVDGDAWTSTDALPSCDDFVLPEVVACVKPDDGSGPACVGDFIDLSVLELSGEVQAVGEGRVLCPEPDCYLGIVHEAAPSRSWWFRLVDNEGMGWTVGVTLAYTSPVVDVGDIVSVRYYYYWDMTGRGGFFDLRDAADQTLVWIEQGPFYFADTAPLPGPVLGIRQGQARCDGAAPCGAIRGYDIEVQTVAGWTVVPYGGEALVDGLSFVNAEYAWRVERPTCTDTSDGWFLRGAVASP